MTGEHPNGRAAIDRMVERERKQAEKDKTRFNPEKARKLAIESARRHDHRRNK
jgi:hypothetical protein